MLWASDRRAIAYDFPMFSQPTTSDEFIDTLA